MKSLPSKKKSAEEIEKLRESLSHHGAPPQAPAPPSPLAAKPTPIPAVEEKTATPPTPTESLHTTVLHGPKPVRSLKRSERIPEPTQEPIETLKLENPEPTTTTSSEPKISLDPHHFPKKAVHSLRKSEQAPLHEIQPPPPDSKLPHHRHSNEEIQEIRRKEILAIQANQHALHHPKVAHLALVISGYLLTVAAVLCYYYYQLPILYATSCIGIALLIATFIILKKPLSQHHAAYIAILSVFIIIFGLLHYFPQLRYGA